MKEMTDKQQHDAKALQSSSADFQDLLNSGEELYQSCLALKQKLAAAKIDMNNSLDNFLRYLDESSENIFDNPHCLVTQFNPTPSLPTSAPEPAPHEEKTVGMQL